MSISRPQKKPTHSPSFLPRINPKDDTAIINRFGEILAKERVLNSVVCNKKHKVIIINNKKAVALRNIEVRSNFFIRSK